MNFSKVHKGNGRTYELIYNVEEHSFDIPDNNIGAVDFDIMVNYLTLQVFNSEVVCVSGFCSYKGWKQTDDTIKSHKAGSLTVLNGPDDSYAYRYSDSDNPFPIWFNPVTGWVCVGDSKAKTKGVEFIRNCVAVLNRSQDLVALWLKPQFLNLGSKTILEQIMS
jgi:hypothetical protein